jgi:hypothetical protein
MNIPERDWKLLRSLHQTALERFCERVLTECRAVVDDTSRDSHERFLQLFELILDCNGDIASAFDDLRRSTALQRLLAMRELGVVEEEDLANFSDQTRGVIERNRRTDAPELQS